MRVKNKGRAKSVAVAAIVLIWGVFFVVTFFAVKKGRLIYREWETYKAQVHQAKVGIEDPIVQYDPLLGWSHIPGKVVSMGEMFPGEKLVFEINNQGFRGRNNYTRAIPDGKKRIVAIGDSFTFGIVNFNDTWPSFLERKNDTLEVINMGATGFGLDQMFLWYQRDGSKLKTNLVICAVIRDDFRRVYFHKWLSGCGRPRFSLKKDRLVLGNVPVPHRIEPGKKNIHRLDLINFIKTNLLSRHKTKPSEPDLRLPFIILREFRDLVEEQDSRFLVVYLPEEIDFHLRDPFPPYLRKIVSGLRLITSI